MDDFSRQRGTPGGKPPPDPRLMFAAAQPKTWLGKAVAAVVGVAVMLLAFFLSLVFFAVVASLVVVAAVYMMWIARRARRAAQGQVIDNEADNPRPH